jgi:hypothetical protein
MYPNKDKTWYENVIKLAESGEAPKASGNLYEVNLRWPGAREATDPLGLKHFLDFEREFSKQSPYVKDALKSSGIYKKYRQNLSDFSSPIMTRNKNMRGENVQSFLENLGGSQQAASQMLNDIGIKGISYLDAGSRGKGGTSNYVIFDDQLAEILRRNPGLLE